MQIAIDGWPDQLAPLAIKSISSVPPLADCTVVTAWSQRHDAWSEVKLMLPVPFELRVSAAPMGNQLDAGGVHAPMVLLTSVGPPGGTALLPIAWTRTDNVPPTGFAPRSVQPNEMRSACRMSATFVVSVGASAEADKSVV